MRAIVFVLLIFGLPVAGETIDGIAATVDNTVITLSDLDRLEAIALLPRRADESVDQHRDRILQHLIARMLQRRDIRRFSDVGVNRQPVDRMMEEVIARHGSREAFERVIAEAGLNETDVRELVSAEVEVRTYIDERFAPHLFVPQEDIERYYDGPWSQQRREQGLAIPPISEVRERLRDVLRAEQLSAEVDRWTRQLRSRANVDVFVFR